MKASTSITVLLALLIPAMMVLGCSGRGPEVVDPDSGKRDQVALFLLDADGATQLAMYSEQTESLTSDAFAAANPGETLPADINGLYEAYEHIYLHNNTAGTITVLDSRTREKLAELTGFHASADSGLCGMAFSNLSDVWAIASGAPLLYHIDGWNLKLVREIALPGKPTSITTGGNKVFVSMILPDGRFQIGIISSNSIANYAIEKTLDVSQPIIFSGANSDGADVVFLGSGGSDGSGENGPKPKLFFVNMGTLAIDGEVDVNSPSLDEYLGQHPTFASLTRDFYLYLATGETVLRLDTKSRGAFDEWFFGEYRMVAGDYWTDLVYARKAGSGTLQRVTKEGVDLSELVLPAQPKAMLFVNPLNVQ